MGGPHVGMLSHRWGQGDTVVATWTRGLIEGIGRTGGRRVNGREGGVTGYTCERWVVAWLGGAGRARVREWEVTVRQVVMLVVRQGRCRMVVVVMMERRA